MQITVRPGGATGLTSPDVFYFGNLVGEVGDVATPTRVSGMDLFTVRASLGRSRLDMESRVGFDRDGRVTAADLALARANPPRALSAVAHAPAAAGGYTSATEVLRTVSTRRSLFDEAAQPVR